MSLIPYCFLKYYYFKSSFHLGNSKKAAKDFPGGAVVKSPPANARDMDSIPGPGRSHMPQSS